MLAFVASTLDDLRELGDINRRIGGTVCLDMEKE